MYAFVPLVQVGPRLKRPFGFDRAPYNHILLNDKALIWFADPVNDPQVEVLAEDKAERLALASRAAFSRVLADRAYDSQTTLQAAVVDLLKVPPQGRWSALRGSKTRKRVEVWLGPGGQGKNLLYSEPYRPTKNSQTFVDNFNRANGELDGDTSSDSLFTWDQVDGTTTALTVTSNQARHASSHPDNSFCTVQAAADLDTDDHYAQIEMVSLTHVTDRALVMGPVVRFSGGSGYSMEVGYSDVGSNGIRIIKRYDNDAEVVSDATLTTSGTLRLEVDGSSLTGKVNGVTILGPSTNTQFTGQLRCGTVFFQGTTDESQVTLADNFQGGDLVAQRFILGTH